jgi:hypothetical protein
VVILATVARSLASFFCINSLFYSLFTLIIHTDEKE